MLTTGKRGKDMGSAAFAAGTVSIGGGSAAIAFFRSRRQWPEPARRAALTRHNSRVSDPGRDRKPRSDRDQLCGNIGHLYNSRGPRARVGSASRA